MAERAAYSHHNHDHDHHSEDEGLFANNNDEEINNLRHNNNNNTQSMQIVSTDHNASHATYIVQIPKDQIYRVPPPENAEIVKRYSNPVQNKQPSGGRRCAYWFLSIFFVVAFIISVVVCVHKFTLSPKPPSFSIKQLFVNEPSKSSSKKNVSPGFQVSMETSNPNRVNDLGYNEGSVSISYKGKQIGKGPFPALDNQGPGKSDPVNVTLTGSSKGGIPKELENPDPKSHSTKGKSVSMNLTIQIPVKLKTWLWTKIVDFDFECELEAEYAGDHYRIESQKCNVHK